MTSNPASKHAMNFCCYTRRRQNRKRSKELELRAEEGSNEDFCKTLSPVNFEDSNDWVLTQQSITNESHLDSRPKRTPELVPENSLSNLTPVVSIYPEKTDTLDVKRDHSSTVTSLDEVMTRISLSGSVSSEPDDNLPSDIPFEHYLEAENDEDYRSEIYFQDRPRDSLLSEEDYTTKNAQSTEQRVSMVSSGYGSMKTTETMETSDIPFDETPRSSIESTYLTTLTEIQDNNQRHGNEQNQEPQLETRNTKAKTISTQPARNINALADILAKIEETLKCKNMKPQELANMSIQLPNFSGKYLTNKGGRIKIPGTHISLYVPPGALNSGDTPIFVFIYLHPKSSRNRLLDGRKWLTPNVECGPRGLSFVKDVYLTMPHYAVNPTQWDFDGHQTKQQADGDTCTNTLQDAVVVTDYEVTMMLDHFCSHGCSGRPSSSSGPEVRKWVKAGIFFHRQDDQHMQIRVKLCDLESSMAAAIQSESFPINECASKAFVVVKGMHKEWQLDEDPVKVMLRDALGDGEAEVAFTVRLKDPDQIVDNTPTIACTVDVFQHNNNHRGVTLELEGNEIPSEGADGTQFDEHDETNDIQIQFLLEQDDIAPTVDCGISNKGFSELCMHLENGESCDKGWRQLAEEIGFTQYQYVLCIERRAQVKNRSPAAMVLDMVFKNKDSLEALKGLSNIFTKMEYAAAIDVVDKEMQDIIGKQQKRSADRGQHGQNSSLGALEDGASKVNADDGYASVDGSLGKQGKSISMRTKVFLSSIQSKMHGMSIRTLKRKPKSSRSESADNATKDSEELNDTALGQMNTAYEAEHLHEVTHEACSSRHVLEIEIGREAAEGPNDVDHEISGSSVPKILVSSCGESSTDGEIMNDYKNTFDMNENDSSMLELNDPGLTPTSSAPNGNRDSGISSISGGSRDSWKSVTSHELTVCTSTIEEEF